MVQAKLLQLQSRLSTLPALKQNQCNGATLTVAHQPQPLWLHAEFHTASTQLAQPFRFLHQKKISAIAQTVSSCLKQSLGGAAVIPSGGG
jgi:hypothetical protein